MFLQEPRKNLIKTGGFAPDPVTKNESAKTFSELGKETQEIALYLMAHAKNHHELYKSLVSDIDFQESINSQSLEDFYQVMEVVMFYFINEN